MGGSGCCGGGQGDWRTSALFCDFDGAYCSLRWLVRAVARLYFSLLIPQSPLHSVRLPPGVLPQKIPAPRSPALSFSYSPTPEYTPIGGCLPIKICRMKTADYQCGCFVVTNIRHCKNPDCWKRVFYNHCHVDICRNQTGGPDGRRFQLPGPPPRNRNPANKQRGVEEVDLSKARFVLQITFHG